MKSASECPLADGFSVWEKAYAQLSFFTMGIAGTAGISLADWRWVSPYLLIYWYGIPGIIMRHLNCPRCPHLQEYDDCLQFPPTLTKRIVKRRKTTPFSKVELVLFWLIALLIPAYPIYWLRMQPLLLGTFLLSAGLWYGGQLLYFCKRCRVEVCPFNRAKLPVWSSVPRGSG